MNLLITGAWQQAKEYIPTIESKGHQVQFLQFERDELPCEYEWVEGIIGNGIFLSHPIEKFVNLKYIQLTSAGFDRVPMDYVKEHGIEIHNARGVYSAPMAELAVAGVLELYKKMRFFYENQKKHNWEKQRGLLELFGKTVVIVGCGDVGIECAKRFRAFGCTVIGVNRTARKNEVFDRIVPLSDIETVLPEVDLVVLTVALTEETRHLMDAERLKQLKNTAILINIARGRVVDTNALINCLPNLGGAVLDVFEEEPLNTASPLWDMENVIITPHNSFVGDGNQERLNSWILLNLKIAN